MTTIAALVDVFAAEERPACNVLDLPTLVAQALAAVRRYAGFAKLGAHASQAVAPPVTPQTELSLSEWAVIRPLFILYAERETALQLEASRAMGIDVFGRSSGEIAAEITQIEADMPRLAFYQPIVTV